MIINYSSNKIIKRIDIQIIIYIITPVAGIGNIRTPMHTLQYKTYAN